MEIQHVTIKEFKCLKDVDVEINGGHVMLIGDNGLGKSSFMQFIQIAMGKKGDIPPGATGEGVVVADKNGKKYTFKVRFKDGKPVISVLSEDGMTDTRKGAIAGIVGAIEFDIHEFVNLSKSKAGQKEQVKIFKSFLPFEVRDELERLEANVKSSFDERTEDNRELERVKGAIKLSPVYNLLPEERAKIKPVDVTAKMSELKAIQIHNNTVAEGERRVADRKKNIEGIKAEIAALQEKLAAEENLLKTGEEWLAANTVKDTAALEEEIKGATDTNKMAADIAALHEQEKKMDALVESVGTLTANIEAQREAIARTIREMQSPVAGLTYDEEQLMYNGVPVHPDSMSTSEIMELGIRLKMAENPDLGILFIERTESFGEARWKTILEMANKAGWQIIAEQVKRGQQSLQIEITQADELVPA